jgi:alpha-mannosidase
VYADARAAYEHIFERGKRVRDEALQKLIGAAAPEGSWLIAFNPAPFPRNDPLEVTVPSSTALPILHDEQGQPLPLQEIEPGGMERRFLVGTSLPLLGYRQFSPGASASQETGHANPFSITREVLENPFFRLRLDERGQIASLYDKRVGREVIAPGEVGNRLLAFEDRPIDFDAWDINIYYNDKAYLVDDVTSWRVVEAGPLRGGVEVIRRYGKSTITQRILLYADVPRIDFPTQVDWHEQHTLLKAAFPVTVNSPRATFDIQWGNLERPTHWNTSWDWARFETWAHKWADLSEGDYGVSLLNDCKYGYDVKGHTLRLTLLRGATWPDPGADQGTHEFSYALLPHSGDWRVGETVRHAYLFNMPAVARLALAQQQSPGEQAIPPGTPFVAADRPGVVIETIKPAEDGDGIIVRLYEAYNTRGPATLTFAREIASAEETNMLEELMGPAAFSGREVRLHVRPYGISTFRVRFMACKRDVDETRM